MEQLGELQEQISEIKKLDGEVIAFSIRDTKPWVKGTKYSLKITYTMISTPNRSIGKKYGFRPGGEGMIIIDKKGRIRYKDINLSHSSSSLIIRELKGI